LPFTFEVALHTYFRISEIRTITIEGLHGKTYLDKVDGMKRKVQDGTITIGAETDRVYLDAGGPIILRDADRTVRISPRNGAEDCWRSTIVWNPWIEKAKAMKDLGDDEWTQFVCIESGAVADNAVTLAAGQSYMLAIEVEVTSGE
jgi:glucose-6-phosphate 1-epimerase